MAGNSKSQTTTDHATIRAWAESRGGKPVTVRGTGDNGEPGVLRIDFPGGAGSDRLEEISWDEWFEKFDQNELAFLLQENKASGEESTFFKLVRRSGEEDQEQQPAEPSKARPKQQEKEQLKAKQRGGDDDLAALHVDALLERAEELGIAHRHRMNKQELIAAIQQHNK